MTAPDFNLADQPWVPCGGVDRSLRDLYYEAHELPGWVDGEPLFTSAVMRLLSVMTYRITGLDNVLADSEAFRSKQTSLLEAESFRLEDVDNYFDRWRDRFWLTGGSRPFLQDPTCKITEKTPDGLKLVMDAPAGNNPLWGNQSLSEPVPFPTAARHLLIQRFYGAGGTRSPRSGKGRATTTGSRLRNMLSMHPVGGNLYETLILNLVPANGGKGFPEWEKDLRDDPLQPFPPPSGILEVLGDRADKCILLARSEDGAGISQALITQGPGKDNHDVHDPYLVYDRIEDELDPTPRKARWGRAAWRELDSLGLRPDLSNRETHGEVGVLTNTRQDAALRPSGWVVVAHSGDKSKEIGWQQSAFGDLLDVFADDEAYLRAEEVLDCGQELERQLSRRLKRVWSAAFGAARPPYDSATHQFWIRVEQIFWAAVEAPSETDVVRQTTQVAAEVFTELCNAISPADLRVAEEVARSRNELERWRP